VVEYFKWNNFEEKSKKKFQFEIGVNFEEVQTFEEKSINLPKIFLDMIFNTVNLD
jgi:hypothetical protein